MAKRESTQEGVRSLAESLRSVTLKLGVVSTGLGEHGGTADTFRAGLEAILNDQIKALEALVGEAFILGGQTGEPTIH